MDLRTYLAPRGMQTSLATALGVPPELISQWVTGPRQGQIPLPRCVDIEIATGGIVTCEEIRPDYAEYFQYLRHSLLPA